MYLDYWKLACRPFDERIDPDWFFASGVHQGAVLHAQSIIGERAPVALVSGAVGSGKSTVVAALADLCAEKCLSITLRFDFSTVSDMLNGILSEIQHGEVQSGAGFEAQPAGTKPLIERLRAQLSQRREAGQHMAVYLDPSDHMPEHELGKVIESFGAGGNPLPMTLFLVGSTELLVKTGRLTGRGVQSIPQCVLGHMAPGDTTLYVRQRIHRAGGDPSIFSESALELIHDLSGGLPRRINRLCDLCLLVGYSKNCDPITPALVWTAQGEIRMLTSTRTPLAPPTRRWRRLARTPQGRRLAIHGAE